MKSTLSYPQTNNFFLVEINLDYNNQVVVGKGMKVHSLKTHFQILGLVIYFDYLVVIFKIDFRAS